MTEEPIAEAFVDFVEGKGLRIEGLSPSLFPQLLFDYYDEVRVEGLVEGDGGDLLLFQYGIYDWGDGKYFELDFTRQYYWSYPEEEDSHEMVQQRFTFYFDPEHFGEIVAFNVWSQECESRKAFQDSITKSAGYLAALEREPIKFETHIEDVC